MKALTAKKIMIIFVICVVINFVYFFVSTYFELKYPRNESHSRYDCSLRLKQISSALHAFIEKNSGVIPADFYELMSMNYRERKVLLCPSQFTAADKNDFLKKDAPVYISSYRLMTPEKNFYKLNDSEIIVKEFQGNHPEAVVNKKHFPAGFHVIAKDGNDLKIEFINISQLQNQEKP
jgi:hypothetical protein